MNSEAAAAMRMRLLFFLTTLSMTMPATFAGTLRGLDENVSTAEPLEEDCNTTQTDYTVVYAVNAFILALLLTVCSWFWCCGGAKRMVITPNSHTATSSDVLYQRQVLQRRLKREQRGQMTPEERKAKILQSIQRNRVHMVSKRWNIHRGERFVVPYPRVRSFISIHHTHSIHINNRSSRKLT
jgi:hypothetical protein